MVETMNYAIVLHKDPASDYGVTVPDLPGCFSAGKTADDALAMAKEAIELHLEGLIEDGGVIPLASPLESLRRNPEFAGGTWAIVTVDEADLRVKVARVGITMPQRVLDAIDRHAKAHGETRSGLLARAAVRYIGRRAQGLPESTRGGSKARALRRNLKEAPPKTTNAPRKTAGRRSDPKGI